MSSSTSILGVDMNDPTNLALYSQLVIFRSDQSRHELIQNNPDSLSQRTLQTLAHHLGLEFEYSLTTRNARISRPVAIHSESGDFLNSSPSNIDHSPGYLENNVSTAVDGLGNQDLHGVTLQDTGLLTDTFQTYNNEEIIDVFEPDIPLSSDEIIHQDPTDWPNSGYCSNLLPSNQDIDMHHESSYLPGPTTFQSITTVDGPEISDPPQLFSSSQLSQSLFTPYPGFEFDSSFETAWQSQMKNDLGNTSLTDHVEVQSLDPDRKTSTAIVFKNLPFEFKKEQLLQIMKGMNLPLPYTVSGHYVIGKVLGLVSADFKTPEETSEVIRAMDGLHVQGQKLVVDYEDIVLGQEIDRCLEHGSEIYDRSKESHIRYDGNNPWPPVTDSNSSHRVGAQSPSISASSLSWYRFNFEGLTRPRSESSSFISYSPGRIAKSRTASIPSDCTTGSFQNSFRGTSRTRTRGSSDFQEIVFDSKSGHSIGSQYSGNSGRRSVMSRVSRAASDALRKIGGACWKCKFSRQVCGTATTCNICEKPGKISAWKSIGCKRGLIKESILPIHLCPVDASKVYMSRENSSDSLNNSRAIHSNNLLQENLKRREAELMDLGDAVSGSRYEGGSTTVRLSELERVGALKCFAGSRYSYVESDCLSELIPLNECILAIAWELIYQQRLKRSLGGLVPLLQSAALFQSKVESDQLIAQSLICLRSCMEATPLYNSGACDTPVHISCQPTQCKIECIANLNLHLGLYLDELQRVIFKKENMRKKGPWWLSVFYSLCIQAYVRKFLVALGNCPGANVDSESKIDSSLQQWGFAQYLHVPIRLFTAISGRFDPIKWELVSTAREPNVSQSCFEATTVLTDEDITIARTAVSQHNWEAMEIESSFHYLKRLFEDPE